MTRVVAHTTIEAGRFGDSPEVPVGTRFDVVTEPQDIGSFMIFMQLKERGELENVLVVDFGEGYVIFKKVAGDGYGSYEDYFTLEEN